MIELRDRVKELRRVPASSLRPNARNWRTHSAMQTEAIRVAFERIGFAGAELVRELPDGTLELLDGHARRDVVESRFGDADVPVLVLDLNDREADLLLATYDPLGQMAGMAASALAELVGGIKAEDPVLSRLMADMGREASRTLRRAERESTAPAAFPVADETTVETNCTCPKCGYKWSNR